MHVNSLNSTTLGIPVLASRRIETDYYFIYSLLDGLSRFAILYLFPCPLTLLEIIPFFKYHTIVLRMNTTTHYVKCYVFSRHTLIRSLLSQLMCCIYAKVGKTARNQTQRDPQDDPDKDGQTE